MRHSRYFMIGIMVCLLLVTVLFSIVSPTLSERDNAKNGSTGNGAVAFMKNVAHVAALPFSDGRQKKVVWGAYTGDSVATDALFETMVERKMDLRPVFVGWNDPFPSLYGPTVRDNEKTLVVFWEQYGVTLDNIIDGSNDHYIGAFASSARAYAGPVMLAPFHEMNGEWSPWSGVHEGNSPEKVIRAWKHIHGFFRDVPNVKFAWTVNNGSVPDIATNAISAYYPGDLYVDYVAVDGFNDGDLEQSWEEVFGSVLNELKRYHKPIYILSMATAAGDNKSAWITDALTIQIPKHPEVVGWVWFNENKEKNWLVDSDPAALRAFKAGLPK